MYDIFKELKRGVDFNFDHIDPYTVISQMLVEWCETRERHFSDLIIKIKVGDDEYTVFYGFDSNGYYFVSEWDWYEGEDTIQILDIKRLDDVFNDECCGVSTKIKTNDIDNDKTFDIVDAFMHLIWGRKVRMTHWDKGEYIKLVTVGLVVQSGKRQIINQDCKIYPAEQLLNKYSIEARWEDYKEEL